MHRLSFIITFLLFWAFQLNAQSPHGKGFRVDCAQCHDSGKWLFSSKAKFRHESTGFRLEGQHANADCKACHKNLSFAKKSSNCVSCHADVHSQTVGSDCARCHTSKNWIVQNVALMHEQTSFPLRGVHKTVDCKQCHQSDNNVKFTILGQTCKDCHIKDFQQTKSPNHTKLNLSRECTTCHNTNVPDWKTRTFPDHNVVYPLTGAHAAIAQDCDKCHVGGNFNNTPKECIGCHNLDFGKTTNPNHKKLNISTDCASCHSTNLGWAPATFQDHDRIYPLTGAHKTIAKNCIECHQGGNYNNTLNTCNACHNKDYNKTTNPNHASINLSTDCASCHTTNPGWSPANFTIHNQYYPLTGAHNSINCKECHKGGIYKNTPTDCNACHNSNYLKTSNPNHTRLGLTMDCASCHSTKPGWAPATFSQHATFYPLTGAHSSTSCAECHQGGKYTKISTDCSACHTGAFQSSKNPNHVAAGFSTDCASCHTTNPGWRPSTFDHNKYYTLTGAHATIASNCTLCHAGGRFANTPTDCNACHNATFKAAQNPNHVAAGFSTDCASCHTTNPGWRPSTFNHNNYYPLTGAHASVASNCTLCHAGGRFANTPTDCNACHNATFKAAQNPNHVAAGFSTDCASCHTTNPGWRPSTFNHNNYYPLTGAHASVANNCTLCHAGGRFANTPTDCNACHNGAYQGAKNPNHATAGFSTDCASCHTTNPGWRPSTFDHNKYYILTGAHATVASNCILCHAGGRFANTPTDCNACHNATFKAAQNPNHVAAGFSTDCASCHTTNPGWRPSTFNHNNYYPLTGAHSSVANNCTLCHAGGRFANTPTDCNACHNSAYQGAKNPNHATAGFSTDCASCHTTNPGWRPSTFNHNNYYPLTGAHASVASNCTLCHAGGRFANTPTDCNACHNGAYQGSRNPNHATGGFSTDCASCHTTNPGWRPSTFNHNNYYPLVGAHAAIANNCTQCHVAGNFKNTPSTCMGCHASDYTRASPNHSAAGFPTDCTTCHSQSTWKPANWNHDAQYFPIYSGSHKGTWSSCTECHTTANNFRVFNCLNCHKKSKTDSDHKQVKGYSYNSTACYSCHPRGK